MYLMFLSTMMSTHSDDMMFAMYWNWRLVSFNKSDLSVFIRYSTSYLVTCPFVAESLAFLLLV